MQHITAPAFDLNGRSIGHQTAEVDFHNDQAISILYKGINYYTSGKFGKNAVTGEWVQELSAENDTKRIWVNRGVTTIWED
ncbi:hypothetical protein ACO0LF_03830 [Undibacterium sp. Di27W]|uniref:hypothetical protein n=1 Tax=Undibacterium sp. Di27W TaxID=3413036 RepID=UPI003BF43D1A